MQLVYGKLLESPPIKGVENAHVILIPRGAQKELKRSILVYNYIPIYGQITFLAKHLYFIHLGRESPFHLFCICPPGIATFLVDDTTRPVLHEIHARVQ